MRENESTYLWEGRFQETSASVFLLLLLLADCAFIFLHFLLSTPLLNSPLLSLKKDHGYPEVYQYIKELWIVALLLFILIKTRVVGYSVWVLVFLYILFDDALRIHERLGKYIAIKLEFTPFHGIRANDFGELAVSAVAAALLLTPMLLFYMRGANPFRQVTRHLLLLLLALAFFGVFIDMIHVPPEMGQTIKHSWGAVEDGGEMIIMSLIAWYTYLLNIRNKNIGISSRSTH